MIVLFALQEEMAPFKKRYGANKSLIIACSGTGAVSSAQGTNTILEGVDSAHTYLIICGFAGGLSPDMKPGDLIVPRKVIRMESDDPFLPDNSMLVQANDLTVSGASIFQGALLSTNTILSTPAEKRAAFLSSGAFAVDMETVAAAQIAEKRNIRWLSVRVITDGANDHMPFDFNRMLDRDGQLDRSKVVLAALSHPWKLPGLIRLGKRSSKAAHNLMLALDMLIRKLPDLEK